MSPNTYLNNQNSKTEDTMLARTPESFPEMVTMPDGWDLETLDQWEKPAAAQTQTNSTNSFPGTTDAWL